MQTFNKIQLVCIDWYESREINLMLNAQSRCVCALFAHRMQERDVRLPIGRGIIVEYAKEIRGAEYYLSDGWHLLKLNTNVEAFIDIDSELKKKNYFHSLIVDVFARLDVILNKTIPTQAVLQILADMKADDYNNIWHWGPGKKFSPSRKLFSQIMVSHEIDHFEIKFKVFTKDNKLAFEKLTRIESAQEPIVNDILGQLIWVDDKKVEIIPKSQSKNKIVFSGW